MVLWDYREIDNGLIAAAQGASFVARLWAYALLALWASSIWGWLAAGLLVFLDGSLTFLAINYIIST